VDARHPRAGHSLDLLRPRSAVPSGAPVADRISRGGRPAPDARAGPDPVALDVRPAHVAVRAEVPVAMVPPGHAVSARRKRRPADVPIAESPVDPGRRPHVPRHPDPAVGMLAVPAPVVERRPAPVPVAGEEPSSGAVAPRPTGAVRDEITADDRARRDPDHPELGRADPPPIGREGLAERLDRIDARIDARLGRARPVHVARIALVVDLLVGDRTVEGRLVVCRLLVCRLVIGRIGVCRVVALVRLGQVIRWHGFVRRN
jgi:hypothetical protein